MAGSSLRVCEALVLAYPCSIDSGPDAEIFVDNMTAKEMLPQLYKYLDIPGPVSKEELVTLTKEKWGSTTLEDKTQMLEEVELLRSYARFVWDLRYRFKNYGFVETSENMYVNDLLRFLTVSPTVSGRRNAKISVVCLIGHGFSEKGAKRLQEQPVPDGEFKTPCLELDFNNCYKSMGNDVNYTPHTVTKYASVGDVYAFHAGILSPKWIIDQLKKREKEWGIDNLVIIVLDSCYSGQWVAYFTCYFAGHVNNLKHTKIIVQTSCGRDEESYGGFFIPLWRKLQTTVDLQTWRRSLIDSRIREHALKQRPSLYTCTSIPLKYIDGGVREVTYCRQTFRFFSNSLSDFFQNLPRICDDGVSNPPLRCRTRILEEVMFVSSKLHAPA